MTILIETEIEIKIRLLKKLKVKFKFIFKNLKNVKNAIFFFQKINFLNYTFHTRIQTK